MGTSISTTWTKVLLIKHYNQLTFKYQHRSTTYSTPFFRASLIHIVTSPLHHWPHLARSRTDCHFSTHTRPSLKVICSYSPVTLSIFFQLLERFAFNKRKLQSSPPVTPSPLIPIPSFSERSLAAIDVKIILNISSSTCLDQLKTTTPSSSTSLSFPSSMTFPPY